MKCRHCNSQLSLQLVDLGSAPPSNFYLMELALQAPEKWFPLRVLVCEQCWLVQTEDFAKAAELFDANYAYFSSFSTSFQALTPDCELIYVHTADYNGAADGGLNALGPRLGIQWPIAVTERSKRDAEHPMQTDSFVGVDVV